MMEITPLLASHPGGLRDAGRTEPIYEQLYAYLKKEIRAGRIPAGNKLPSQRRLAVHLGVGRNTVDAAYQQLFAEGYLRSEPRRGLFVCELPETERHAASDEKIEQGRTERAKKEDPLRDSTRVACDVPAAEPLYDFRYGNVDTQHFPYRLWRQFSGKSLSADNRGLLQYGDQQGELELRRQIADYLYQARGVRSSADQIVIGAGMQWLLDLLCRLIGREAVYGMEEPGYSRTRTVFEDCGRPPVTAGLDESGIRVDELRRGGAQVVYVTPSHQFPTGIVMPVARRLELIEWARTAGGTIIEDDYDSEFCYERRPIPSLHSLDTWGNTVYLGTFSKSLMPSIRIGYLVLPEKLIDVYREKGRPYKQTASRLDQHTLALFMQSGEWARHLNRMRNLYKKKYTALIAAIRTHMDERVRIIGAASGVHLLLEPRNGKTETELIASAEAAGVRIYPVAESYRQPPKKAEPRVLVGYAGLSETDIGEGIQRLAEAWT